jgi:D-glycero-alpha-D-manno-heptose 1-phosphate guanylyltransferase
MTEAIVLAGGLGTRLRAAVPDLPKPMAPVAGRPFLEWLLERWIAQGVTRFVLSVGYRADAIRAHFGVRYGGAEIDYAVEERPLGTGGGLLLAAARLAGAAPFLVLNGDTLLDVKWRALASFHEKRGADLTLALIGNSGEGRYGGVQMDADGRIGAFGVQGAAAANGGVYWIGPRALQGFGAGKALSLENDLLPALIARGARMYGLRCTGGFIDIGLPEDYARAAAFLVEEKTERTKP